MRLMDVPAFTPHISATLNAVEKSRPVHKGIGYATLTMTEKDF